MPSEKVKILQLPFPKYQGYRPDVVRLINVRSFDACASNAMRCRILGLIAQGVNTAADIAKQLNMGRTAVYRHLNALEKHGWIVHTNNKFFIAAKLFLAFDMVLDAEGKIVIQVLPDRGAFVDETVGLILVKGPQCHCEVCVLFQRCLRAVKELARKLDVKIRSETPLAAFKEIVETLVKRDVATLVKKGYLVVKSGD